jgi:transcription initiation factor TFIID subunit 6
MKKTQKFTNIIQLNAESLGIKSLDNEIIDYLNVEIEEKMKLILLQAQKFIRISKRKTLKVDDLGHSLKLYNLDEPIGYDSYSMIDYEKIDTVKGLWRMKQNVIDIEDYLSKPMAIYPMQPFPHFFWFAIEGKRPNIPENFIRNDNQNQDIQKIRQQQKSQSNYLLELDPSPDNMAKDINNNSNVNNDNNELLNNSKVIENNENNNIIQNNNENKNCFGMDNSKEDTKKINHVIHNISKELQIFFENFKQRFKNEMNGNKISNNRPYLYLSEDMQKSIEIIKTNPGVVELVPYIINFLMEIFENFSSDIKISHCILHYINSIINNQTFFLEPYLHQILIIIISFILYESDEKDKSNIIYLDPIIRFKFYAIKVLEQIIFKYFIKYHDLQFQLIQIFMDNICFGEKEEGNYLRIFGAIEGLKMIGPVFTKKIFEKKGLIENKDINKDFEIFLNYCKNDKEICNNIANINFRKDFNEKNIEDNNKNPYFSNIDSFFKNDFNKRKKFLLFVSYQNAIHFIKDINI